jgi:inorganic pyrophosphatase
MDITQISAGRNPPTDLHALIEIPVGGTPVKYELDKRSGAMFVDRFLHTAMFYPGNYGFIPQTLSEDGDPIDVLVIAPVSVVSGAIIRCRPVGALLMEDQAGLDEKIIAVPVDDLHPFYNDIASYLDLPQILRDQTAHFFNHYKDLEHGKWTRIGEWVGPEKAAELIMQAIQRAEAKEKLTKPFGRRKKDAYKIRP